MQLRKRGEFACYAFDFVCETSDFAGIGGDWDHVDFGGPGGVERQLILCVRAEDRLGADDDHFVDAGDLACCPDSVLELVAAHQ